MLPLSKQASVLVTGPTANLLKVLNGGWTLTWQGATEALYPKDKPTLFKAIQQKTGSKVTLVSGNEYTDEVNVELAAAEARNHDVVVLALGEQTYTETLGNIETLNLSQNQIDLAKSVFATGKPVVLVTLGGRPRIITDIAEKSQAVILGFLPGMEGGAALADILYGDVNPSAKLPISYPRNTNDIVPYDYKPIESFESNQYRPLYPFGHGLSYTTFETSGLRLSKEKIALGESIDVNVNVKNTGARTGKETLLVYLNDVAASVTRPNKQLKAFKKLELNPGQQENLHFTLTAQDMSFIGVDMKRIVEPGVFTVMVGDEMAYFNVVKN